MPFQKMTAHREGLVQRLVERLIECPIEGIVKTEDMVEIVGERQLITAAREAANRDHGAFFKTIYKVGIQRLHPDEAHTIGKKARTRIRRTAKKALVEIGNAITMGNDVSNEAVLKAYAEQRILGLHVQLTHQSSVDKEERQNIVESDSLADAARKSLDMMRLSLG